MYDHILVPISPEEPALSGRAIEAARSMLNEGGRITVLTVLETPPAYAEEYLPEDRAREVLTSEEARLAQELSAEAGVSCKAVSGHPARAILDEADAGNVDCIVIASHRPGPRHFFLGSTAARVARRAKCSVHVLR